MARRLASNAAAITLALLVLGCGRMRDPSLAPDGGRIVGRVGDELVTAEEVQAAINRLPRSMRGNYATEAGRREVADSLLDRRRLLAEARARHLDQTPSIVDEVRQTEERLLLQALLDDEERRAGPPSEAELRETYAQHRTELTTPERVKFGRVLARVDERATAADRERARRRAAAWQQRLVRGEALVRISGEGDGPERSQGGLVGTFARTDLPDPALARAVFDLGEKKKVSDPVQLREGWAVLVLMERIAARTPTFEEARPQLAALAKPARSRKLYEALVQQLRTRNAGVASRP